MVGRDVAKVDGVVKPAFELRKRGGDGGIVDGFDDRSLEGFEEKPFASPVETVDLALGIGIGIGGKSRNLRKVAAHFPEVADRPDGSLRIK